MKNTSIRAKSVDTHEWLFGNEISVLKGEYFLHYVKLIRNRTKVITTKVDPTTINKCTDTKDITGKDIYENDIVKIVNTNITATVRSTPVGFKLEWYNNSECFEKVAVEKDFLIIGNIYKDDIYDNED